MMHTPVSVGIAMAASAAACALLVVAEARANKAARYAAKAIASASFVAVPWLGGALARGWNAGSLPSWIALGLVFGALGDLALLGHSRRAFLVGLVAFLFGHIAYVVGAAAVVDPAAWLNAAGWVALVPLIVGAIALRWLWPHLGRLRIAVIAYVLVIIAMVIAALALARGSNLPTATRAAFVVGAVLFFASDLAVARNRFVAPGFVNHAWGLPAYYAGQLLIAWAALPR